MDNMQIDNKIQLSEMRRKERRLTDEEAVKILSDGEYGILATIGENGYPYAVPVNYVVDNDIIYIHGTHIVGQKAKNIEYNPQVSFTVVGKTEVLPEAFGTRYESAIAYGTVVLSNNPRLALEKFIEKYSSEYWESGMDYIEKLINKIRIYEIQIETITGKARK